MIGVIGGYGEVGLQAARVLKEWGKQPLRIGGRNPAAARRGLDDEFPQAEWVKVDLEDDRSLAAFVQGCDLIVNCAGPSHRTAARVAGRCLLEDCHHVDAGVDKGLETLCGLPQRTVVLYAAGATPGLAGLLPRWLAKSFDKMETMLCYTGALDRFTASAAEDYLAGVADKNNKPLAAWRNGACRAAALHRKSEAKLPFFSRPVTLYPYLDAEAEFVARSLGLREGEWYIASDGTHVSSILEAVCAQFLTDREIAIKRLCTASELDLAGRQQYITFVMQFSGMLNCAGLTRTLILQADSPGLLTGTAAAAAGIAVLEGEIAPGVCPLAEIPDPAPVIDRLRRTKCIKYLKVLDCSVDQLLQVVEGEI